MPIFARVSPEESRAVMPLALFLSTLPRSGIHDESSTIGGGNRAFWVSSLGGRLVLLRFLEASPSSGLEM